MHAIIVLWVLDQAIWQFIEILPNSNLGMVLQKLKQANLRVKPANRALC